MRYGHVRDLLRDGDRSCSHDDEGRMSMTSGEDPVGIGNSNCYLDLIVGNGWD